jgi:hypothetical protein
MYCIKYFDMFRAILCSSSGGQNCISTASGIVTLYERPCSAPVESGYIYYRIKKLCLKWIIKTSLYYDARSEKHQMKVYLQQYLTRVTVMVYRFCDYEMYTSNYGREFSYFSEPFQGKCRVVT